MRSNDADGFALVAVLITLVALTALATGGYMISNTDYEISNNHTAGARAFNTADAAMYDHMGQNKYGTNSVNYNYSSGGGTVGGTQLLDLGDGNFLYRITASGLHTGARGGTASRDVSLIAMSHDGGLQANAALTAGGGVLKNGTSGTITGFDNATVADCSIGPQTDVAGVATGPGMYSETGGGGGKGGGGGGIVPTGNPPLDETQSAYDQIADLGIDWAGIEAGTAVTPDFSFPGDSWPNFNTIDPDWWPVFMYNGNGTVSPSESGRGTLIVTSDLEINGSFNWTGIILVGGEIVVNGNANVEGTAIAGLDVLVGGSVTPTAIANGTKVFQYNSCWVRYAAQQFVSGLIYVPGTWSEGM